jgi:hypothetical protein
LKTHQLLDRLERLFPDQTVFADLRRSFIDDDRNSLYRLLQCINDSQIITTLKKMESNPDFNEDSLSQGQIQSKRWLINELTRLNLDLGTVFLCAGWYGILATLMFESGINAKKIVSFDVDESCHSIAETFNKPWVSDDWKFKSSNEDILDINFHGHTYTVYRADGSSVQLFDIPDTVINTSCEHIDDFEHWYNNIPLGKIIILQSNDYFDLPEHVNCVKNSLHFAEMTPLSKVYFTGELELENYTRYMRIGIR